ncbi:D-2-hydroxyacid dehydrogenase [Streptomyces sp. NPDC058757]|uniref:D-2-hydroxyacid dehydrogenase n=1 Tax=unclassified Streptomyces TaxID=2593676 RepID=UPI0036B0ACCA
MTAGTPVRVLLFAGGADARLLVAELGRAWPGARMEVQDPYGPSARADADVALVWEADEAELTRFVAARPELRWLHTRASGLPGPVVDALRGRDVLVTNGSGTHGPAVAEHVVALLLAHFKGLPGLLDAQRERRWSEPAEQRELRGSTVGVLGLGDLGRSTARLLTALGAVVVGLRRDGGDVPEVTRTYRPEELPAFLRRLDVLVVATPLTGETRSLIGAAELALLPRGAFLVNVGRGPVVCEEALLAALADGHLAGAGLDVFAEEPLPASSPLWSAPGVVLTPHCADGTERTERRCRELLLDQVRRFSSGERPLNVVDLDRGY